MSDALHFAEELASNTQHLPPWPVLVVDDDGEVHAVTRLALQQCIVEGRSLELISAHSAAEAEEIMRQRDDIALILLDVVMESEHAGLELVHYIREVRKAQHVRVVLRTGQPGQAPAREVMRRYQIDDYRTKTELNFERLHILVASALRTYRALTELARSNRELERFAYIASHDLQTPLRGIVSFTQLLAQRYQPLLDAAGREYVDFIVQGGRDLQRLIQDLLAYARVRRDATPHQSVNLNTVLQQVLAEHASVIASRKAEVQVGELPMVHGDAQQLAQLFRNLIDNALKFQPGPKPWVRVEATADADPHRWRLAVRDGGIGIAVEHQTQIFDVFVRLHTQDEYPGSGMGLALCAQIVRMHGGTMEVESAVGAGTTMRFTLPRAAAFRAAR